MRSDLVSGQEVLVTFPSAPVAPAAEAGIDVEPVPFAMAVGAVPGPEGIAALAALEMETLPERDLVAVLGLLEAQAAWLASVTNRALCALRDVSHAAHRPIGTPAQDATEAEWAAADREWDREQVQLAARVGEYDARRRLATAVALRDRLPATALALGSGRISARHADALAAETAGLGGVDAGVVERSVLADPRRVTAAQFRARARALAAAFAPELVADQALQAAAGRFVRSWLLGDGSAELRAVLPVADMEVVTGALNDLALPSDVADARPAEMRRADALVELCLRHLRGEGGEVPRPGARLMITVPLDSIGPGAGAAATLADAPLSASALRRFGCDSELLRVCTDPLNGTVLDMGRTARIPNAGLRRAIEVRDGGRCTFPTCGRRRGLHAHHLVHWLDGGTTDQRNLTLLCARHHHAVHDEGWEVRRRPGGQLAWTSPTGQAHSAPAESWRAPPDDEPVPY